MAAVVTKSHHSSTCSKRPLTSIFDLNGRSNTSSTPAIVPLTRYMEHSHGNNDAITHAYRQTSPKRCSLHTQDTVKHCHYTNDAIIPCLSQNIAITLLLTHPGRSPVMSLTGVLRPLAVIHNNHSLVPATPITTTHHHKHHQLHPSTPPTSQVAPSS